MQIFRLIQTTLTSIVVGLFMLTNAHALEKDAALNAANKVYQASIHTFYSINGFYNFSANQADQEQKKEIQFSVGTFEDLLIDISGLLTDSEHGDQVAVIRDAWADYEKSLDTNVSEVERTGYPDLRLAGELAKYNISLIDALDLLYRTVAEQAEIQNDGKQALSHDIGKTIALMMTKYSARSTSTVSQVYARGDTDITIDALAKEFTPKLNQLISMNKGNEEALSALDSAKTKWEFIVNSYINYNENRVNFVVNLYSKRIIEQIEQAGAS